MKLGIIGVGHLAGSILKGLLRAGYPAEGIVLAPRGRGVALAAEHGFGLGADNGDVVSQCDTVLLATRPGDAPAAVAGLPWRADHLLMSACAGVPIAAFEQASPATIMRIMPITAAEQGASPTVVFPHFPKAQTFLDALGFTIPLDDEAQFEAATVQAAVYGWAQALIRSGAEWGAAHGLAPGISRQLAARTFLAAGLMQTDESRTMDETLASLCTPGGLTELGLTSLNNAAVPEAWDAACSRVLDKLRGHSGP